MAAAVNFSGIGTQAIMCSKAVARLAHGSLPHKETFKFEHKKMKIPQHGLCVKRKEVRGPFCNRGPFMAMSSNKRSSSFNSSSSSPSETVKKFYTSINEKNLKQLHECISENCYFEECSFVQPFQGKKEVMQFLDQLTSSMGQNVKFIIGHVCEGDEYTAGVNWHLEWKNSQIPFTRGCSFFECSKQGDGIKIKKAQVVIESPIKPGGLVLTLFRTVTSLFDDFPKATEWFLKSPHVIVHMFLKIYSIFLKPFINPLLEGYITFWNIIARFLLLTINILRFISKFFFK